MSRFYLTEAMKTKIRRLLASGISTRDIGLRFGIAAGHVRRAVRELDCAKRLNVPPAMVSSVLCQIRRAR